MEQIFRMILSLSISGGSVGLLILLFRPLTRRYFAKRWTYYLWLLLLVRLLVPIHGDINLMGQLSTMMAEVGSRQMSVKEASESGFIENAEAEKANENVLGRESTGIADETLDTAVIVNTEPNETAAGMFIDRQELNRRAAILQIAGIIWILGVFLTAVYRVYIYKKFVKGINAGCISVTDRNLFYKNAEIHTRLRLAKELPLYENATINTPMLIGLRKPYIVLPSKLLAEMAGRENDICLILHHELIHYKRRDIWYKWLFQAALCVHWFNPLLYLFNRKFNVDCELACDEAMMALLSENGRRMYGNVLLDVAEKNQPEEIFAMHRNVPMMTLIEEKCTLKERLREIAKFHKKGFVIGFCSALVLAAFTAVAVVCGVANVRIDSEHVFVMRNDSSGIVGRVLKSIPDIPDVSLGGSALVNKSGNPYRMYDDDALIAGESEHDTWLASNYCGGGKSVDVGKLELNGSDEVWIVHANKETTLEIFSMFDLRDGRFKFVWVRPDQTVQTLNESGDKNTVKITLPQGRNVIKMVGQKARVKDVSISYGGVIEADVDGIYRNANQEYAYQVLEGKQPIDVSRLEGVCPYLEPEMVSILFQKAWKEGVVLSEENWEDLFIYSDAKEAGQYLLEELERGGVEEFDSRMLIKIAPYMSGEDVSECFRYLLERGNKVSESDLENIFIYSDANLSARYLIEASKRDGANEFDGKILTQLSPWMSSEDLTDLVLALGKDELAFNDLRDNIFLYLGDEQTLQCVFHYIDLGNVLTDSQLRDVQPYVSEEDFYRVIEYNGKNK